MDSKAVCRVCGSDNIRYLMTTQVNLTKLKSLEHCRCRACGSVFVSTQPDRDDLSEAYSSIDWDHYFQENCETTRAKFVKGVEFLLASSVSLRARILDIGGGDGMFAEMLIEAGYSHVSVHEIPGASVKAENVETVFQDFDYQSIPDTSFDVVTMMDVFEHVPDPSLVVAACHRILKPGGILYFHTPVVTPMDRAMHVMLKIPLLSIAGKTWVRGRTSVFHLENYTGKAFEHLFRGRFDVVTMDFKNELSRPVSGYVRVYLTNRLRWPDWTSRLLAPLFYFFIATDFFNPNKAVVCARRVS